MSQTSASRKIGISVRTISLFASVALHAAVLATVSAPIGETATGPAESSSTLYLSVQRSEPADDMPRDNPDLNLLEKLSVTQITTPASQDMVQRPDASPEPLKVHPSQITSLAKPRQESTAAARINTTASSAASRKGAKTTVKQPMQIAASGQSARLSRDYRSTLLRLIERHKYYPLRARRNGLEGTTTVAFTVSSNGEIGGIALAQSSGMSLLDQAAVQTIKRVGKAPPFPAGIDKSKWRFVIPLAYNIR